HRGEPVATSGENYWPPTGRTSWPLTAGAVLRDWLISIALPQRPAGGPLLVINGDADQTIRPQWVQEAVDNACAFGDSVQHIVRAGQTHNNLDPGSETAVWLQARFRGESPPSDC
ncbi:hypothetical protein RCF19_07750, partial [Rhodococcus qingshengii]